MFSGSDGANHIVKQLTTSATPLIAADLPFPFPLPPDFRKVVVNEI